MADIKLFICCHQPTVVPEHPLFLPIQAGAALANGHFPAFLHDDTENNISKKNRSYCELTVQYWAWKNVDADYYGFFHYRRYLYPDLQAKRPYRIEQKPTLKILNKLGYEHFAALIQEYDFIVPMRENMYLPVWEHYANAPFHHQKDLELVEQIVQELFPEYVESLKKYFLGTTCYFGNIFIMKRERFQHYCKWLFSILDEFDKRADISNYGPQELRVNGYLAERLLGGYCFYHQKALRILELPRLHFCSATECIRKRAINVLFPPGSQRRAYIKRMRQSLFIRKKMKISFRTRDSSSHQRKA